jgi:2-C-methyl-D-erythritol 4-phosphate cytidylyltransferase
VIVSGVVLAAEDRTELGPLDGTTLIDHAVSALRGSGVVVSVVVAGGLSAHDCLHSVLSRVQGSDVVVLHDAHRPLAPAELVVRVVEAVAAGADAAVPVVEVTETVKEVDPAGRIVRTVPRESLVQIQFPQAVRTPVLVAAHRSCAPGDPLIPAGAAVRTVPGAPDAFRVSSPYDLELAAAVLATRPGG